MSTDTKTKTEHLTTETPAFAKLMEAIHELTEAGIFKCRNSWDGDMTHLHLHIVSGMRSPEYNRPAVGIEIGKNWQNADGTENYANPRRDRGFVMVSGDEADKLDVLMQNYPIDTTETDGEFWAENFRARIKADAARKA